MNKELEDLLYDKYPKLFSEFRNGKAFSRILSLHRMPAMADSP